VYLVKCGLLAWMRILTRSRGATTVLACHDSQSAPESVAWRTEALNGKAMTYRAAGHAACNSGAPHIVPSSRFLAARGRRLIVGGTYSGISPAHACHGGDDGPDVMTHFLRLVARHTGHGSDMLVREADDGSPCLSGQRVCGRPARDSGGATAWQRGMSQGTGMHVQGYSLRASPGALMRRETTSSHALESEWLAPTMDVVNGVSSAG